MIAVSRPPKNVLYKFSANIRCCLFITSPNWQAYLIKRPYLLWLRDHSTHWRATCRYNTDGTVYTDYLRASLEDFDIIRDIPLKADTCRPYEYVNIRGNECVNCTALTGYKKGSYPLHGSRHENE